MADLTNYEYQNLIDRIENRLKDKSGWGDSYDSSVGQTLIEINAEAADILSYMLERRSQENFMDTARLRSSVMAKASEMGYRPQRSIASSGQLTLTLEDEDGNPKPVDTGGKVIIEEGKIVTFEGENFVVSDTVIIQEGETQANINITQGIRESLTFDPSVVSTLEDFGYITIPDYENIAEGSISVSTQQTQYKDIGSRDNAIGTIGSLSFSPQRSGNNEQGAFYDIRYTSDGMRIQFGDNTFGRKPEIPVNVFFVRTKGNAVRVVSTNNNFYFESDVLTDSLNVTPPNEYNYSLINQSHITGGSDAESINDIKVNAPIYSISNNRAVNMEDYNYWAKRFLGGGIVDAKAFSEMEMDTLLFNMNNIYISYLTETGEELTNEQKKEYIEFIKERDVALAHVVPIAADELQMGLNVALSRNSDLPISDSELYDIVRNFLINYFERTEGSIGNSFQKSDLINSFYDLQTVSGGTAYDVVGFVDIDANGYYPFTAPADTNRVLIEPNSNTSYLQNGDTFILTFNDSISTEVTVTSSDISSTNTNEIILNRMRDEIYANTNYAAEVFQVTRDSGDDVDVMIVYTKNNFGSFVLEKSGTISEDVKISYEIQPFPPTYENTETNKIEPNTLEILNESNVVVFRDNGNGNWEDQYGVLVDVIVFNYDGTYTYNGDNEYRGFIDTTDPIDYNNGKFFLPSSITDGKYKARYKQNEFGNFKANEKSALTLIHPKISFEETEETLSKIRLL